MHWDVVKVALTLVGVLMFTTLPPGTPIFDGRTVEAQQTPIPRLSPAIADPREEFRRLGWEVYLGRDAVTEMPEKRFEYRIFKSEFLASSEYSRLLKILSAEKVLLEHLLAINPNGDELKSIYVTSDDFLTFSIASVDKSIGKDGRYLVLKKVDRDTANAFRRVSPDRGR